MDDRYKGLFDMLDGGGAGRAGQEFEGGPLSGLMNALGIRPMGYRDRLAEARPQPRPMGFGSPPPQQNPQPQVATSPLIGSMSVEEILQAITRGAPASPYLRPDQGPPTALPSMAELMEMDRRRRAGSAAQNFEMGRAFPPTYR